jgi:hypothetical protein
MLIMAALLASGTALAAPSTPSACSQTPDVRNLMTVRQYTESGLDKLSEKELNQLNAWLARYTHSICGTNGAQTTASSPETHSGAAFGKPPEEVNTTSRIVSHIQGVFHGWTGNTRFQLTNGQVWVQAGPGYYQTNMKSPKVIIKKLLIGYILEVNGKEVFVRRIQ